MGEPILALEQVHTYYGAIHALKGVSCSVPQGSIVCLIGANGAGKTTTLMTVFGAPPPTRGRVLFKGEPIHRLTPEEIAARGVAQSPEGRQIFPRMTTLENLEMGAFLRRDRLEVTRDLEEVFALFPVLKERRKQLGGTLSGGEQQMLSIGRALMSRPELLLLDEPSLGLAPKLVEAIFETIETINQRGTTIFLVEQNAHMALTVADAGYVMETGRVTLSGPAQDLALDEAVRKAYLGED